MLDFIQWKKKGTLMFSCERHIKNYKIPSRFGLWENTFVYYNQVIKKMLSVDKWIAVYIHVFFNVCRDHRSLCRKSEMLFYIHVSCHVCWDNRSLHSYRISK